MTSHSAVVTGGSRGIGRAIVVRLLDDGHRVVTCGRGARPPDMPADVRWVQADVAAPGAAQRIVDEATDYLGSVTLLVNNAGVQVEKTVLGSTDQDWDTVIDTNCRGLFAMCCAVLPAMTTNGGVIVNIGSISATVADGVDGALHASKAFVHGLTRSIAVDHGPLVRCNTVCPGWIKTDLANDGFALADDPKAAEQDALDRHPAGRFGDPADIAHVVAWLASDAASFVTGQSFTVDGGLTVASPLRPGLF